MSQLRSKIKTCLQTITRSIKQIPQDKQVIIATRVNKVLQKYTGQQSPQSLQKFNKQLEFNLNFIKLSYPNINFNFQQGEKAKENTQQKVQQITGKQEAMSDIKTFEKLFQVQNAESLKKQMKNISGVREEVQFSNWSEGNVDPENLKRHKELLTRQHYGGQFWKGKERPKMQSAEVIANLMQNSMLQAPKITDKDLEKKEKTFVSDPEKAFERVKRL